MAACPKCGAAVSQGSAFCSACGSSVASAIPPAPGGSADTAAASGVTSNVAAVLCYVLGFITGIVFLVMEPYKRDKFVRFHAFQSIFFSIVVVIFHIVWSNLFLAVLFSAGFLWTIFSLVGALIYLAIFVFWLFLMYKAYSNETFMIPVIGEMAAKQAAKQDI